MTKNSSDHLRRRLARAPFAEQGDEAFFAALMEKRFEKGFDGYWRRFGYEIGGPVCYAFVKWILSTLEQRHSEVTGLAFVARDGWLLRQVYGLLAGEKALPAHYVYAPRSVCLRCQEPEALAAYRDYISRLDFGGGAVGVVDTVTMKFSSLRLIDAALSQPRLGLLWVVLKGAEKYEAGLSYEAYQPEDYHTIACWNLMEFIMTSPEPPIVALDDGGRPVFRERDDFERAREARFAGLEAGALEFVRDVVASGRTPGVSNRNITRWVNDFLKHPDDEARQAFSDVMVSERADHSDSQPMNPFHNRLLSPKDWKDALWFYSQRHPALYSVLRWGKRTCKELINGARAITAERFRGGALPAMADRLSKFDVVSFDIFDTLVFRPFEKPTDLFYELEREQGRLDFHDVRIQAERDARQLCGKPNGEIDIYDIYARLRERYGLDVAAGVRAELDAELRYCYANPEMRALVGLLKARGKRMIATSDMYLPGSFLRELLDGCGYSDIGQIFVSCEQGVGKAGGGLQRKVQAALGPSLGFVHVGDNFDADVKGSREAGWDAIYYRIGRRKKRLMK